MRRALLALTAIARVTVAEAVRSRIVLGLIVGLGLATFGIAAQALGDGTEEGRARVLLATGTDLAWALLALAAVFLSTQSLARELEDGRAVPIALAPVPRAVVLAGKWLGLAAVLGGTLALALTAVAGGTLLRARLASPAGRDAIEREVLVGRAVARPPRLETSPEGLASRMLDDNAAQKSRSRRALTQAQARLDALAREGRLPRGMSRDEALARLVREEAVRLLSVPSGHEIEWVVGPLAPADVPSVALRYRYRVLGDLPPGRGPKGVFTIESLGVEPLEREVSSAPDAWHELAAPGEILQTPYLRAPVDGTVGAIEDTGKGERILTLEGTPYRIFRHFDLEVAPGARVKRGDILARSDRVFVRVKYRNEDASGIVVVFPPEGVELLHRERGFEPNVLAAFAVLFGRLLFVTAVGLALSTFLDGKVAALATAFVLVVAAGHGFLVDAIGPIIAGPADNVFGPLDAPLKALLRGLLAVLPDLGRDDPSEALASGRVVTGALESVGGLGALASLASLALGSWVLGRREMGGGRP